MANNRFNKQVTPKGYKAGGPVKNSKGTSTTTKGNIRHGKLKSQKELKKITDSKEYKKSDFGKKTKMLNVATMAMGGRVSKMGGGMMQRPMYKKGNRVITQDFMDTFIADDARSVAGKSGGADSGKAGEIRSKLGKSDVKFKKEIKNKIKKTKENIKKFAKKTKDTLKAPIIAFNKKAEENYKKYPDKRVKIYEPRRRIKKMGGGSLKSVPSENKGLKKLPTEVRNKMGFMKKGGKVK